MDLKEIAKKVIHTIPDAELKALAESDYEYFVDEFLYEIKLDPSPSELKGLSGDDLKEKFKENLEQNDNVFAVSEVVNELWEITLKVDSSLDAEEVEQVIDQALSIIGYDTINQCVYELGWSEKFDKFFDIMANELEEFWES